jgi:1-acyl-sn-glycerol-3-phosphate acyltransferase
LARECGVPVVPIALTGTADVLPKGGRYSPAPMQARIGEPVDPDAISAPQLREQVVALKENHQPGPVNRYALAA